MENISLGKVVKLLCEISTRVTEPKEIRFRVEVTFSFGLQFWTAPRNQFGLKENEEKLFREIKISVDVLLDYLQFTRRKIPIDDCCMRWK